MEFQRAQDVSAVFPLAQVLIAPKLDVLEKRGDLSRSVAHTNNPLGSCYRGTHRTKYIHPTP
jgi:hypothetical protein